VSLGKYGLAVITVALFGVGGCTSQDPGVNANNSAPVGLVSEARVVQAVKVKPSSVAYAVTAVGSLRTPEHVTISPKKAGVIQKIFVEEGDRVKKGQLVAQLDDVDARLAKMLVEAKIKEAEATVENNRTKLARHRKLLETKVISQQNYDDIRLELEKEEAKLLLSQAERYLAEQEILDHRIVSPLDGVVNLKIASIGEHVNVAPKDEIMTIVQMDPLEVEFFVPENWVGKIRLGGRIQLTVKAYSDETFSAAIDFISPTADPSTRNVRMKARVPNPHYRLKPGFFAEVTIQTGVNPSALMVPESTLSSQEGQNFIYVVENGMAQRRGVDLGVRKEGKVEILKGVREGEWVVTSGHDQLTDGVKVTIKDRVG
jgi:membrane fusion protein (multidrug efflux system)